jgi:peptide/nickel transport system permease protein
VLDDIERVGAVRACWGDAWWSPSVLRFLVRRILQAILVLLGVTLITFALTHLIPGGVARSALGVRATRQQIHAFNQQNGYLLPFWDQYVHLLDHYVHGQFGYSYKMNQSVSSLITERLPKTLILAGIATAVALVVAIPLGIYQVTHRFKMTDYFLTGTSFVCTPCRRSFSASC